jgi:hypothetical protein
VEEVVKTESILTDGAGDGVLIASGFADILRRETRERILGTKEGRLELCLHRLICVARKQENTIGLRPRRVKARVMDPVDRPDALYIDVN